MSRGILYTSLAVLVGLLTFMSYMLQKQTAGPEPPTPQQTQAAQAQEREGQKKKMKEQMQQQQTKMMAMRKAKADSPVTRPPMVPQSSYAILNSSSEKERRMGTFGTSVFQTSSMCASAAGTSSRPMRT